MDTLIYQRQEKGCGFACVKMALAKESHRKEYRHLEEPKIYGVAPSLREIIQYASVHGLILKAYRLSNPKKETVQMSFWNYESYEEQDKTKLLIHELNRKFDKPVLKRASEAKKGAKDGNR